MVIVVIGSLFISLRRLIWLLYCVHHIFLINKLLLAVFFFPPQHPQTDLIKIKESLSRNELSYNPSADKEKSLSVTSASVVGRRMAVTAEVAISKIFPAGFGWQTAAYFAGNAGMEATDLSFFLSTGIGDGLGVCSGHVAYMAAKKGVTGNADISLGKELQVGIMLGSAAVCSGTVWQVSFVCYFK